MLSVHNSLLDCEQNGINYNALVESTIQRAKPVQNVIIYDVPGSKDHTDGSKMHHGFSS
jgi:hypothetical protein